MSDYRKFQEQFESTRSHIRQLKLQLREGMIDKETFNVLWGLDMDSFDRLIDRSEGVHGFDKVQRWLDRLQ